VTSTIIIIDSSVAIKWYLPDETDDKALKIQDGFRSKSILIAVPILFFYEVGNILKTTSKSLRINNEDALVVFKSLLELDFISYSSKELFKTALEKSINLDISYYDASYIALAEYLQIPFYTSDQKLLQRTNSILIKNLKSFPIV